MIPKDEMPYLRMSLEKVSRDFHMHVAQHHEEIQKYITENLDRVIVDFIAKEFPALVKEIVHSAGVNAVWEAIRNHPTFKEEMQAISDQVLNESVKDIKRKINKRVRRR